METGSSEQPVFAAGDAQYTWADVVLAARAWGDRRKLVEQVHAIAGTEYLDLLEQFVTLLYEKVQPYRA